MGKHHMGAVRGIAFWRDPSSEHFDRWYIIAVSEDGKLRFFNEHQGTEEKCIPIFEWNLDKKQQKALSVTKSRDVYSLAVSRNSKYVAVGLRQPETGEHCIWCMNFTTAQFTYLVGHEAPIWCLEFFPDSTALVSGGKDKTVKHYSMEEFEARVREASGMEPEPAGGHKSSMSLRPRQAKSASLRRLSLSAKASFNTEYTMTTKTEKPELRADDAASSSHVRCLAINEDARRLLRGARMARLSSGRRTSRDGTRRQG